MCTCIYRFSKCNMGAWVVGHGMASMVCKCGICIVSGDVVMFAIKWKGELRFCANFDHIYECCTCIATILSEELRRKNWKVESNRANVVQVVRCRGLSSRTVDGEMF